MYAIETSDLSFSYDKGRPVLDSLSLRIGRGEAVGLIGANGAGKSTLLRLMVGLLTGYQGEMKVCGIPVTPKTIGQVREKTGFVFQDSDSQLFLSTVQEDVSFGPRNQGLPEEEVSARVSSALMQVRMAEKRESQIYKLSGGQKKLAAIAGVLAMGPEIVLFDEPSVGLDPKNRRNLAEVLHALSCTKIIASHDMEFVKDTCGRVLLLSQGKIAHAGTPEEILDNAELLARCGL